MWQRHWLLGLALPLASEGEGGLVPGGRRCGSKYAQGLLVCVFVALGDSQRVRNAQPAPQHIYTESRHSDKDYADHIEDGE